jgi:hypothetical protein
MTQRPQLVGLLLFFPFRIIQSSHSGLLDLCCWICACRFDHVHSVVAVGFVRADLNIYILAIVSRCTGLCLRGCDSGRCARFGGMFGSLCVCGRPPAYVSCETCVCRTPATFRELEHKRRHLTCVCVCVCVCV